VCQGILAFRPSRREFFNQKPFAELDQILEGLNLEDYEICSARGLLKFLRHLQKTSNKPFFYRL